MRAAATTSPRPEFQDFLYAPICQDQEGMALSMLSALARQDFDPWSEAARLSQLPKEEAIRQITNLLDGLPRKTLASLDRVESAARLSALLPTSGRFKLSGQPSSTVNTQTEPLSSLNWRFVCLYLGLVLMLNLLMAEIRTHRGLGTPAPAVSNAPEAHTTSRSPEDSNPTSSQ